MKKSKHFRKDVIMARIIAALILVILIASIVFVVSLFSKTSADKNKDSQNTENTQQIGEGNQNQENNDTQNEGLGTEDTQMGDTENQGSEEEPDTEVEDAKIYVKTTTQVKLRKEPNTDCATLDRIDGGTKLEVLETLEGWYKVSYNGQIGYVSATYAQIVEE